MPDSIGNQPAPSRQRSPRHRWWFRGLAILCGLSLFGLVEVACVVLGLGESKVEDDPFVDFHNLQPLFERDESGNNLVTSTERLKFFARDEFPATKPAGTTRIFCLGGSTVQGRPFSKETSFTTWLQLALTQAQPDRDWDVINCGGISYASYRLTPILQECLNYEPDAIIVCTGHNEFLEDRSYGKIRDTSPLLTIPFHALSKFRSFRLLRQVLLTTPSQSSGMDHDSRNVLDSDVDAFLDYKNGIAAYHRDDAWRRGVVSHFESNLDRMIRLAKGANIPILLVVPPSNLADSPPFKSEHKRGLAGADIKRFQELIEQAGNRLRRFPPDAVGSFEAAIRIDNQFAATRFELGQLLESLGETEAARHEFLAARDNDICPLRILTPMTQAIFRVSRRNNVPLLDSHQLLEERTRDGILDSSLLVDHVHPSFEGHQIIALTLVEKLRQMSLVHPKNGWQPEAREVFQQHFDQLPDLYFAKGEQNLANLRYWTQGMADGPPVESRPPQKAMRQSPQNDN